MFAERSYHGSSTQDIDERLVFMQVFLRELQHLPQPSRRQVGNLARQYEKILQDIIDLFVSGLKRSGRTPARKSNDVIQSRKRG